VTDKVFYSWFDEYEPPADYSSLNQRRGMNAGRNQVCWSSSRSSTSSLVREIAQRLEKRLADRHVPVQDWDELTTTVHGAETADAGAGESS